MTHQASWVDEKVTVRACSMAVGQVHSMYGVPGPSPLQWMGEAMQLWPHVHHWVWTGVERGQGAACRLEVLLQHAYLSVLRSCPRPRSRLKERLLGSPRTSPRRVAIEVRGADCSSAETRELASTDQERRGPGSRGVTQLAALCLVPIVHAA